MQRLFRQSLLAGFAVIAGLGAAHAQSARPEPRSLPPLVSPATPNRHAGKPIFLELVTPDLDTAKLFYGTLFGWSFRPSEAGATDYAVAMFDEQPIAALIHRELPSGQRRLPAWLTFFSVGDVAATQALAKQYGAQLLSAPHDIPGLGREAIYADPQGAVFATLASRSGDPQDRLALPGEWIWASLQTTDPDTDAGFYQSLFNYEVFDLPDDAGGPHFMLASDEYARASVNRLPAGQPNAHPYWLNYIRVIDADATITRLVQLGGHVIVPPHIDRHGGRLAVVSDPAGAAFGLMEWTESDSKQVAQ
jgi:hypothetical protein